MSIKYCLSALFRRTGKLVFASGFLFTEDKPPEKPDPEKKLTLDLPDATTLSYEYMIKQSALEAVNKATQMLTVTYAAITAANKEYRNLLTQLIVLLEETVTTQVPEEHWDRIVSVRVQMQTQKEAVNRLHNYMTYVHNMGITTSELCYLTGMDQLSETLYQRLSAAVQDLKKEAVIIEELERDYNKVQEECIKSEKNNSNEANQ